MTDSLRLVPAVAAEALEHAREALPNEACGLIAGRDGLGTTYRAARNAALSPYRFDLHPEDLVRLIHEIEGAGDDLVAIFHSHPGTDAVPSPTDVREARYAVPHLIAARHGGEGSAASLRAWRIGGAGAVELPLAFVPGAGQQGSPALRMRWATASRTMSISHEPSSSPDR